MPVSLHGSSQKPPGQNWEQHWLPAVHRDPVGAQLVPLGGPHLAGDPLQLKKQQSAFCPHADPSAAQGVSQT